MTVHKKVFQNYLTLQASGRINMTNFEVGAKFCGCNEDEYLAIIFNYNKIKEAFKNEKSLNFVNI